MNMEGYFRALELLLREKKRDWDKKSAEARGSDCVVLP